MSATDYPPHVLREYALIADGERGALCGPRGDLAWLCAPRWHDDAVLSTLVGGSGVYAVTPIGRFVWGGAYETGSLVWRSRWVTQDTIVECREALARPADPHRLVLLRRVLGGDRDVRLRVLLDIRAGFGQHLMTHARQQEDGAWTARSGDLWLRWRGGREARRTEDHLELDLTVASGQVHDLVLEISDEPLPDLGPADELWATTEATWRHEVPELEAVVGSRDARQSLAVLHGLTSGSGAMVAAATMSLPERADQPHRSYDYRYAWIRDQCYAGIAAARVGDTALMDSAVAFVSGRLLADGAQLKPAYLVDGGAVPDEVRLDLPGYPGGADVRGNWVNQQFQLDALGEVLLLLSAAHRAGRSSPTTERATARAVEVIEQTWQQPDAGVWELDDDWWTHSRLTAVAGLRAAARDVREAAAATRIGALADTVLAETTRRCLHPDGYWQQSPGRERVDAALLLPAVRGALPADDPRTLTTLAAVQRDLVEDGYVYRFRPDARPLGSSEGAFLLCGFVMSLALHQQGDRVGAFRYFERTRAACGSPGLLSEEVDVAQRQLRGNLPQAFVHALLLETAGVLGGDPA